jgi:hypothetical protein
VTATSVRARWAAAGALLVVGLVAVVYRGALDANFHDDDFNWLFDARRFDWAHLVDLARYSHFYRPVVELYFTAGLALFGCAPAPFHALSIAIHLANVAQVFLLARALTGRALTAYLGALLFSVQPGYVEAVVWVGAITDLLPAFWKLLALNLWIRHLQAPAASWYAGTLAAFILCLGTHESAVTILPTLVALDALLDWPGLRARAWQAWGRRRLARYAPFAVLLLAFLAVTYYVNSRSYLVQEGYYRLGWHAVPKIYDYLASLYVGRRRFWWRVATTIVVALIAWRGTPRMRFYLLWMLIALLPVSFFTWGNASRYLYVPAVGFAMLAAELLLAAAPLTRRLAPRRAGLVLAAVVAFLVLRFAVFAAHGVEDFREVTRRYDRFNAIVRQAHAAAPGPDVHVPAAVVENIDVLYRDAAAETALCRPGVRVVVD